MMTSPNKMAASFLSGEYRDGVLSFKGAMGDKVEEILAGIDGTNDSETAKAIVSSFTKATLLEFKRKHFEIAVERIGEKEYVNEDPNLNTPMGRGEHRQCEEEMSLANRRSKPLIADDKVVLARFLLNIDDAFPTKILKSRAPKQKTTGHQTVQHDRVEVQKPGGEDGYIDPTT